MMIVFLLTAAAILVWFWLDSLRAREQAVAACAAVCGERGLQFLDQTVALSHLGLKRNARGRLQLFRAYAFDYSTDGTDRWPGRAVLLGAVVMSVEMA